VTRTTTIRLISEQLPNLNSRKRLSLKSKLDLERALKRQLKPEKTASSKKRKTESILSIEIKNELSH
jgi:hypothetical protein